MKILVDIPKNTYKDVKKFVERSGIASAGDYYVAKGQILPDDCEILTKEAYEDLCARASMSEQAKWLKGM